MKKVGFQQVITYGDFTEKHKHKEADFLIHIAEKTYIEDNK
ncbi:hypothetical protein [Microscilla marina]|uniref:Glycine-sarcosine-dimethylglycine methyltransferase n=1 Tax=Microscilla marina ATCC 23134 TaxID=313606 RepID=A1ZP65_MICM2|nr:hypothetical protein [Microscilla marina]EAY27857.1 glycine-sarcosine-dimethylglycine methyltransferase [Microscilla marina ATCC 23134]